MPLGRAFELDRQAAACAATRVWQSGYPFRPRRRFKGRRLVATDVDWSAGTGAETREPIGAILLRLTGRQPAG